MKSTYDRLGSMREALLGSCLLAVALVSNPVWSNDMHAFAGRWELIPELSFYEQGEAPETGIYRIDVDGETVSFTIEWTVDGQDLSIAFGGPMDGELHPAPAPEGAEVSYTRVDASVLESTLVVGGTRLAFARRQVSGDGILMAVLQENTDPDGSKVRITQVYRRYVE